VRGLLATLAIAAAALAGPGAAQAFNNPLQGVSCSASNACTAVGFGEAARWDGIIWVRQTLADPNAQLNGVACPSANSCMAVGGNAVEHWDGVSWSSQSLPQPANLYAVACPSVSDCMAVGNGVAEQWNGSSWTALPLAPPQPPNFLTASMLGISCASANACIAVGRLGYATHAELWNGSTWTALTTPTDALPTGFSSGALTSVSCASATACTAVGYEDPDVNTEFINCLVAVRYCLPYPPVIDVSQLVTIAESWNGNAWQLQSTAQGGGTGAFFGASCPSSTVCTAVGEYAPSNGEVFIPLANRSTNGVWSPQVAQSPKGRTFSALDAVSCPSLSACTAVGGYDLVTTNSFSTHSLVERWNGKNWAIQSTP
jgi:hypothetical protein